MKLFKILEPDFFFEDDRGSLTQITHEKFGQINAVYTKKGAIRGNFHYHTTTKECFYVISGKFDVHFYLDGQYEKHTFKTGDMFMIPENVRHSFDYLDDTYLVALYTSSVELADGSKDIICEDPDTIEICR